MVLNEQFCNNNAAEDDDHFPTLTVHETLR